MLGEEHRRAILLAVAKLDLPDCWVSAGFVRNLVWDRLHGRTTPTPLNDIDVVYFDATDPTSDADRQLETVLRGQFPNENFSVKNQARMHTRNGHPPYSDTADALRRWPETCTALGVAWRGGRFEVLAPFGLADLFGLVVRPTADDAETIALVRRRVRQRHWRQTWPLLVFDLP